MAVLISTQVNCSAPTTAKMMRASDLVEVDQFLASMARFRVRMEDYERRSKAVMERSKQLEQLRGEAKQKLGRQLISELKDLRAELDQIFYDSPQVPPAFTEPDLGPWRRAVQRMHEPAKKH
jgi:hypothetical protein